MGQGIDTAVCSQRSWRMPIISAASAAAQACSHADKRPPINLPCPHRPFPLLPRHPAVAFTPRPSTPQFGSTTTSSYQDTSPSPCDSIDGGCPFCARSTRSARRSQSYWCSLANALGLGLSNDKRQISSQRATYTGIVIDTPGSNATPEEGIPTDREERASIHQQLYAINLVLRT